MKKDEGASDGERHASFGVDSSSCTERCSAHVPDLRGQVEHTKRSLNELLEARTRLQMDGQDARATTPSEMLVSRPKNVAPEDPKSPKSLVLGSSSKLELGRDLYDQLGYVLVEPAPDGGKDNQGAKRVNSLALDMPRQQPSVATHQELVRTEGASRNRIDDLYSPEGDVKRLTEASDTSAPKHEGSLAPMDGPEEVAGKGFDCRGFASVESSCGVATRSHGDVDSPQTAIDRALGVFESANRKDSREVSHLSSGEVRNELYQVSMHGVAQSNITTPPDGVAKMAEQVSTPSEQPSRRNIAWEAPERLQGGKATLASDVYSLGMTIVEAVTGRSPWGNRSDDVHQLSEEHCQLVQDLCCVDASKRLRMADVERRLSLAANNLGVITPSEKANGPDEFHGKSPKDVRLAPDKSEALCVMSRLLIKRLEDVVSWLEKRPRTYRQRALLPYVDVLQNVRRFVDEISEHGPVPLSTSQEWADKICQFHDELDTVLELLELPTGAMEQATHNWKETCQTQEQPTVKSDFKEHFEVVATKYASKQSSNYTQSTEFKSNTASKYFATDWYLPKNDVATYVGGGSVGRVLHGRWLDSEVAVKAERCTEENNMMYRSEEQVRHPQTHRLPKLPFVVDPETVHRDLKGDNIPVATDEETNLAGFGVSSTGQNQLPTDAVGGKAPECLVDAKVFFESFGVCTTDVVNDAVCQPASPSSCKIEHPIFVHMRSLALRVVNVMLDSKLAHSPQLAAEIATSTPTDLVHEVVKDVKTFVGTFAKTNKFVFRLASMRRMIMDLEAIGEKLEKAVAMAKVNESDVADPDWKDGDWTWRKQLQADRDQEELELSNQAAKNALPFARSMRPHEPMEALTLLKFEIDNFKADNSKVHVNSMKKVFFSVVRSSNGRVARIPEWYIPPYALSYARDEGIVGSVGESFHGVWVDRKSSGAKLKDGEPRVVSHAVVMTRLEFHVDAIETFRQEVEIWFTLQHDNVMKLLGASHCSFPAILVTEEASNGPLASYVRKSSHQHLLWELFYQAALGLKFLHENKIVHGNLKSNNILVAGDGRVKLSNFGRGILMLQNQRVQDELVERRRRAEYSKRIQQGLSAKAPPVADVKPFRGMGWRAPNFRAKKQFGRPTFQDDVYSLGLCILDAVVPAPLSSSSASVDGILRVGDIGFNPLDSTLYKSLSKDLLGLIPLMCKENPDERLSLSGVISRMEELRSRA